MRVFVSGAHGFIGSAVIAALQSRGDDVTKLVRREPRGPDEVRWDPAGQVADPAAFEGADAVINLAGENIMASRWTEDVRRRIRDSRVEGTRLLASTLAKLAVKPRVVLCASAVGFYGNRGGELLDELSAPGTGFLADVCQEWESQAQSIAKEGIRTVMLRFGIVLAPDGGALKMMLPIFKLGLGGILGSGEQFVSWVSRRDAVRAILFCLDNAALSGPVNVTAPASATNADLVRAMGHAVHRPALLFVPSVALRLALGPVADETLLSSERAVPKALLQAGFRFEDDEIEPALERMLSAGQSVS